MTHGLFDGHLQDGHVLSNESFLADSCPEEFHGASNVWRACVEKLRCSCEVTPANWLFKTKEDELKEHQILCIGILLTRRALSEKAKAVVAWMMSEALVSPP